MKGNLCGISESRERQGEGIVPALPRSCHYGKSCVELPTVLTASTVGEYAIAGMVGICTAGMLAINTPAKRRACGGSAPHIVDGVGDVPPLRLRGSGEEEGSSDEKAPFETAVGDLTAEHQAEREDAERAVSPRPEVTSPASTEPRPSSSGVRRSRSRNRIRAKAPTGRWTRQQRRVTRQTRSASSSDYGDETGDVSSDPHCAVPKRLGSLPPAVAILSEEDKKHKKTKAPSKGTPLSPGDSSRGAGEASGGPPSKKRMLGPKSARARAAMDASSVTKVWDESSEPDIRERRGRLPITGEYRKLAEAKKAVNDEKERELRLDMEART